MEKHNHPTPCNHMLIFCTPCNEVYCTECEETFTSTTYKIMVPNTTVTYPYETGDDVDSGNTCVVMNDAGSEWV